MATSDLVPIGILGNNFGGWSIAYMANYAEQNNGPFNRSVINNSYKPISEHETGGPSAGDGRGLRVVQAPLLRRMALLVRRHPTHPLQPGKYKPRILGSANPVTILYHVTRTGINTFTQP